MFGAEIMMFISRMATLQNFVSVITQIFLEIKKETAGPTPFKFSEVTDLIISHYWAEFNRHGCPIVTMATVRNYIILQGDYSASVYCCCLLPTYTHIV